jgi:hypothetical protein
MLQTQIFRGKIYVLILRRIDWAVTFWAIFLQTHPVTLRSASKKCLA